MEILILVLIVLVIILGTMCGTRNSISGYKTVESSPSETKLDNVSNQSVLIFHAPWCGHCRRAMPDFLEAARRTDGTIVLINTDDPKSKDLVKKYGITSFPTIIRASGEKYNGTRDANSLVDFVNEK